MNHSLDELLVNGSTVTADILCRVEVLEDCYTIPEIAAEGENILEGELGVLEEASEGQ